MNALLVHTTTPLLDPQRKGIRLPLRGSLLRSVALNVAAVRHLIEMKLSAVRVGVERKLIFRKASGLSRIPQITYLRSRIRISTHRSTALIKS